MSKEISRRQMLGVLGALAGAAVACNLSPNLNVDNSSNPNIDPTLKPVSPIPTNEPTLTPSSTSTVKSETLTPTATLTETPEVVDPLTKAVNELFQGLSYDPKTKLYTKDGKHYKFTQTVVKGCPERIDFALVEVDKCPTKPGSKASTRKPQQPTKSKPGQTPQQPGQTSQKPPEKTDIPSTNPPSNPTVTEAKTQPVQPTRTPGGEGATPIVNTPLPTFKPTEFVVPPTDVPAPVPTSTPSF